MLNLSWKRLYLQITAIQIQSEITIKTYWLYETNIFYVTCVRLNDDVADAGIAYSD